MGLPGTCPLCEKVFMMEHPKEVCDKCKGFKPHPPVIAERGEHVSSVVKRRNKSPEKLYGT
ncbi:MAG: hypothetical protein OEY64_03135 [Nitrospinota bacterium]|nr:hypothetical protein [Nitrospinota bacterium]